MSKKRKCIYDFDVFKALVEIEVFRINRYKKSQVFSIAFLYAPDLARCFECVEKGGEIAFLLRENIRSSDVVSSVEEDFVFLFFPETDKKGSQLALDRIKSKFKFEIIDGIASYPEDGKTPEELYSKLVDIMNEKLIPVIDID